ncbi:unnamed protein product [Cylindrotheca closterium]|uniref:PiggyBac transposable element-derived protein domain-containing protein n=1 Tax=Cylindrotheca closterium TaxID=2856 RepID=A0AAD2GAP1_9STRA|nr:unnamed protein product [Cylindrotheca closterium]
MTGRKFARIMRGLHIAPVNADPADPNQKLQEFSGALLERFRDLYEPKQQLSLDESLIRAFGRIGFKVRVVTKAARYGIKLYVLTESTSGYVLNVEMYTGGAGHIQSEELKKTTQVVKRLCNPYNGSYRTVYVDRFYTSIEVIKELHESDLFVTGTVMANRIPKHLRWTNKYARDKPRGYHECHVYTFEDSKGQTIVIGLTIWKDRKPVIVLTSDGDCRPTGSCKRRSKAERGIIDLNRPEIVRRYNEYMGGVDFADQRRLHAETRLHGLRRWWIRIFFYYVDVGIENAGILYCAAKKIPRKEWPNLLELKKQLVYHFMGSRIFAVEHGLPPADENSILPAHHIEKRYAQKKGRDSRRKCTLCLANGKYSKAGSVCAGCELGNGCCLPFCVEVDRNCWRLFHQMPLAQRERVVEIYEAGQASFLGRLGPPATKKRRK